MKVIGPAIALLLIWALYLYYKHVFKPVQDEQNAAKKAKENYDRADQLLTSDLQKNLN